MRRSDILFAVGLLCAATCRTFAATGCAEFQVYGPCVDGMPIVKASDFGFSETNDFNAAAVNRAIEHCRRTGAHTLELAPGTYRCFDAPGGIAITNLTDFTVDGRGALLIYRRPAEFRSQPQSELIHEYANILVKDCERMKMCNLKMDWDWENDPLGCFCVCDAVHVDEKHENASYIDMVLPDFTRHPKYPEPVPVQKIQSMASSHDAFGQKDHWHFGLTEGHFGAKNEWIGPNRLRIWPCVKHPGRNYNPRNDVHFSPSQNIGVARQFRIGDTYRLQHYYYGKNGFNLVSSRHITLRDIDIWSCFGMAIVIDGKEKYTHIENVRVMPRPDAPYRRPYANANDAIHVARSSGYMKIVNCRVTFNNDDTLNLHDRFTIASRSGARTLEIVNERGIGYFRPDIGDPLELRRPDWRPTGYSATLVGIDGNRLILDRDIPVEIGDDFFVFDRAYGTDNVIVRGCVFEDTSHRSLFSPSNLTIEDCVFRRTGGRPIWILADARKRLWCEGMGETNIVIRNNLFQECPHIDRDTPVISTSFVSVTPWKTGPLDPDFIKDILIEGNLIVDPYGPALKLEAGTDITFRNNEIRFTRPPFSTDSGALRNAGAHNVTIEGNRFVTNQPPVQISCLAPPSKTPICRPCALEAAW